MSQTALFIFGATNSMSLGSVTVHIERIGTLHYSPDSTSWSFNVSLAIVIIAFSIHSRQKGKRCRSRRE